MEIYPVVVYSRVIKFIIKLLVKVGGVSFGIIFSSTSTHGTGARENICSSLKSEHRGDSSGKHAVFDCGHVSL